MQTISKLMLLAGTVCAAVAAVPVGAQDSPYGACVMKSVRAESAARKACNDKHGTIVTPERSACFKQVTEDKLASNAACNALSKEYPKKK